MGDDQLDPDVAFVLEGVGEREKTARGHGVAGVFRQAWDVHRQHPSRYVCCYQQSDSDQAQCGNITADAI